MYDRDCLLIYVDLWQVAPLYTGQFSLSLSKEKDP